MTPETTSPPAAETIEEIAERIAKRLTTVGAFYEGRLRQLSNEILSALRNERERAAKAAEIHYANGTHPDCKGGLNCGISIAKAIREGS